MKKLSNKTVSKLIDLINDPRMCDRFAINYIDDETQELLFKSMLDTELPTKIQWVRMLIKQQVTTYAFAMAILHYHGINEDIFNA